MPQMAGILPLMLFGPLDLKQKYPHSETVSFGTDQVILDMGWGCQTIFGLPGECQWNTFGAPRAQPYGSNNVTRMSYSYNEIAAPDFVQPLNPGFIGVDCTTGENILTFRFPYGQNVIGTAQWATNQINGETYPATHHDYHYLTSSPHVNCAVGVSYPGYPGAYTGCVPGDPPYASETNTHHLQDLSSITTVGPEYFGNLPSFGASSIADESNLVDPSIGVRVSADQWHHVLLSVDFTTAVSVEGKAQNYGGGAIPQWGTVNSTSKMYLAFDDVNRTNQALSFYAASAAGGGGANDVLTPTARQVNSTIIDTFYYQPVTFLTDGVSFTQAYDQAPGLPTYDFTPPNYPTSAVYLPGNADYTRLCEMGELQIFTGVTLNPSTTDARRAFVTSTGFPEPMTTAQTLLGTPNIRLHGLKHWQEGTNTGSSGALSNLGTINPYTPGPSLTP